MKTLHNPGIIELAIVMLLAVSCSKEKMAPDKAYYGKVTISQVEMGDADTLDIYFEKVMVGQVLPNGTSGTFTLPANNKTKLSFYKASTDNLIADTTITLKQNSAIDLRLINSNILGAKGFLSSTYVGADSVKFQFIYNFGTSINTTSPVLDLYVLDGTRTDTVAIVKGLKAGKLFPKSLTLNHVNENEAIIYYFMLKDVATGQFITLEYKNRNFFTLITGDTYYNGHLIIVQIHGNGEEGTKYRILADNVTL